MNRKQLIKKYIEFFKSKNHKEIPNANLIPENDPTTLFISAGMQPLVPFLLGQKHPKGKRLVNVQKCIRTGDIEEVGDSTHHTFFEQLGNWSLGDYWKKEAIEYSFEFLTKVLKIPKEKLATSIFEGDRKFPKDLEALKILLFLGLSEKKIAILDKKENWWGPAGETGPCGSDSEIFHWKSNEPIPKKFDPEDDRWMELGNNVFLEYNQDQKGNYAILKQKNIDYGGGVERLLMVLEKTDDAYMTNAFKPIIQEIEKLSGKKYKGNEKAMRIIADHIKAACFIINDGIVPGNSEQGYVLRRLIRRAIRYGREIDLDNFIEGVAKVVFKIYGDYEFEEKKILKELGKEEEKFLKTLEKGMKMFAKKYSVEIGSHGTKIDHEPKVISGKESFLLYQSYGFPIEMIQELAKEKKIKVETKEFEKELKKHQELSRTASAGKFKSGLADSSDATTKLHTATHLLLSALKKVLNDDSIIQRGSNINPERLRLDYSFDRKLTKEEIEKIENEVNSQIEKSLNVIREEMFLDEAKKKKATGVFDNKYGERVSVYTIGNISKEICTGPHVVNTKELGKFKIKKEESSSSGVRRMKAVLEN